jgi:hypothetical protein
MVYLWQVQLLISQSWLIFARDLKEAEAVWYSVQNPYVSYSHTACCFTKIGVSLKDKIGLVAIGYVSFQF